MTSEKMQRGRPTILTKELADRLAELIGEGRFIRHACAEVGIFDQRFFEWMARGQDSEADDVYKYFAETCARARAKAEGNMLEKLNTFAVESLDWKAIAWQLERMNQELFHLKAKTEISGPGGKPIEIARTAKDLTALTTEELRALAQGVEGEKTESK